jgi:hypothetical protein
MAQAIKSLPRTIDHKSEKSIALRLDTRKAHGTGAPPPAKPSNWRAAKKVETSSIFPPKDPSAPNKRIGKEYQNPREKLRTFHYWPPFGALWLRGRRSSFLTIPPANHPDY